MQELYPANPNPRRYKICLMFDMRFGGPFVCFLWLVLNMYVTVLSFQRRSPIYSYLNSSALVVQGVICLLFFISALISLYSFALNTPRQLKISHRLTWTIVIIFLVSYFVNMILFGVQKPQFDQWCINKSRQDTSKYLFSTPPNNSTLLPNSQLEFTSRGNGLSLYNCARLWEDEVKFSAVVFVILFSVYIHFAMCFWRYTQVRMREMEAFAFEMANSMMQNNNMMNNNMMMSNANPNMMMNLAPNKGRSVPTMQHVEKENNQKSLAQLTRAAFGRLR
ncbi:uncharacterized protein ATC70_009820 [Mucor velutinosus]|uniref:Uncharacterized protein n=1 Tax=Mucor velutinosus TaxID=708070 RepID=A0AAN7DN03_9FUNG|nr:hypothetical protein ATC70_009820 [Mucor velutinosus]